MTKDVTSGGTGCPVSDELDLARHTFMERAIQERPNRFYRTLRQNDPVHYDEQLGMYLVSRHQDLETVFRDPVTFSQERGYYKQMARGYFEELKSILVRDGGGFFPDVANIDPPRHTRVRRLLQHAFTARRMKSLEPEFEALVDARIDSFIELGRVDGLNDLAIPTAIGFSTQQLKVVDLEMATIRRWGAAYLSQFSLMQGREQMLGIARELCDLQRYLIQLVRRRVEHRHDDMLSDLIDARIEDERPGLDFEELVATARAILINTHDSVSTAMSNILLKVATDPVIAERFYASAADERLMSRFVEELLRLEPPVRALSRITTKPITLGGVQLPEGAHLLVLFASGNDDEAVFRCPREFDMNRPNLVRSLTFGSGVHLCLGISLARMQLRVTATRVAKRMRSLCLAVPLEEIRYLPNVALLTVEQLPLEFVRHA